MTEQELLEKMVTDYNIPFLLAGAMVEMLKEKGCKGTVSLNLGDKKVISISCDKEE